MAKTHTAAFGPAHPGRGASRLLAAYLGLLNDEPDRAWFDDGTLVEDPIE